MMIDQTTQEPFQVRSVEIAGPCLMPPLSQLAQIIQAPPNTRPFRVLKGCSTGIYE